MNYNDTIEAFQRLGFTPMESQVYIDLTQFPNTTAYSVAQRLKKNRTNVYKVLESLEEKGAAMGSAESTRKWKVIPYQQLLAGLEAGFLKQSQQVREWMEQLTTPPSTPSIHHFSEVNALIDRCREMIANSRQLILIDAFPPLIDLLKNDVSDAVKRGVNVALRVYAPVEEIEGAKIYRSEYHGIQNEWSSSWLNLICDGSEFVLSYLSLGNQKIHHGYWSNDAYMAVVYGFSLVSEMVLGEFIRKQGSSENEQAVRDMIHDQRHLSGLLKSTSGLQSLQLE